MPSPVSAGTEAMSEADLKRIVVDMAHAFGWRVFSLPMARGTRPVKDASGYPDLTLARNGAVLFLELKTQKGVLSPEQMEWLKILPAMLVIRPNDLDTLAETLA